MTPVAPLMPSLLFAPEMTPTPWWTLRLQNTFFRAME